MPVKKLKPVEAGDGSYAGLVLQAFDELRLPAAETDYQAEMRLPEGKTCGDCVHTSRCVALFGHTGVDTSCDFHPSRYRERVAADARTRGCPEAIYRLLCDVDLLLHDLHGGEHNDRAEKLHTRLHDVMHQAAV